MISTKIRLVFLFIVLQCTIASHALVWYDGRSPVSFSLSEGCDPVVKVAADMFSDDIEAVTGSKAHESKPDDAKIRLYQIDNATEADLKAAKSARIDIKKLSGLTDGFAISERDGVIHIAGSNGRGAAYGLLEMSRKAGVSPWVWWGDVVPMKKDTLEIEDGYSDMQGASVERRGIFINDEDWSLRPWSHLNFEPSSKTEIGAKTYRKIFELLLRLRGNTLWPAMHEGTTAFFLVDGAKEQADSCGIIIGTSHCEPLLRNNVGEWDIEDRGRFNYKTNRDEVHRYWRERLQQVRGSKGGNIFTIGMRGIHDSSMEGYDTPKEKLDALQQVIDDQQRLIEENIGNPALQDQVFVPYKEVLELYEMGLKVPDYVTLMWCDDNHGYLTRLSDSKERRRSGGGGVYYHLSYWGQPHDYLWLTTTQPGLIWHQMRKAHDSDVRKLWIANVHDPKVAGYDLELFMDMAWNIDAVDASTLRAHYKAWLTRQFGSQVAELIFPVMHDFYRLCGERRPEFMGWSQVEKDRNLYERRLTPVRSTDFNPKEFGNELQRYVDEFDRASYVVDYATKFVDPSLYDAYFAAVIYPVCASAAHARCMLKAQEAKSLASGRHGISDRFAHEELIKQKCAESQRAYQEVRKLTEYYNDVVSDGKWKGSMDMRPRDLPVFAAPSLPLILTDSEMMRYPTPQIGNPAPPLVENAVVANADSFVKVNGSATPVGMLGHSMNAVSLEKGSSLIYDFEVIEEGDGVMRVAVIPTHAVDGADVRFSVSVDGAVPEVFSLKEPFRSEQWKQNVMRGQAVRTMPLSLKPGKHTMEVKALDDNIVVDQWMWDPVPDRRFYLFPIGA
ncbi:MAG: glycosyl hydrolase 115 family protein [Muribaculaceae bacterium]|nr:glycosyl hydrolase 115 family protein [Muribaculaceae bacterium]